MVRQGIVVYNIYMSQVEKKVKSCGCQKLGVANLVMGNQTSLKFEPRGMTFLGALLLS